MRCSTILKLLAIALATICVPLNTYAATALFAIGPDASFVPRALTELPETAPVTAAPLADLGDGSIGFNGGLAYDSANSLLYAIGNDSSGGSALYHMTTLGGALTAVGSGLGQGFNGGLAYDSSNDKFYAVANDFAGNSTLYDVTGGSATPLGSGPFGLGFYGGLTFNADDGLLYAIAGDALGVMRTVVAIDVATAAPTVLFDLGDGSLSFNGGVAYDAAASRFYVIGNNFLADSTLFSFTLAGTTVPGDDLAAIGTSFGQGFLNVGLGLAPEVTPPAPVPEPSTLSLMLAGLLGAAVTLWRNRSH